MLQLVEQESRSETCYFLFSTLAYIFLRLKYLLTRLDNMLKNPPSPGNFNRAGWGKDLSVKYTPLSNEQTQKLCVGCNYWEIRSSFLNKSFCKNHKTSWVTLLFKHPAKMSLFSFKYPLIYKCFYTRMSVCFYALMMEIFLLVFLKIYLAGVVNLERTKKIIKGPIFVFN